MSTGNSFTKLFLTHKTKRDKESIIQDTPSYIMTIDGNLIPGGKNTLIDNEEHLNHEKKLFISNNTNMNTDKEILNKNVENVLTFVPNNTNEESNQQKTNEKANNDELSLQESNSEIKSTNDGKKKVNKRRDKQKNREDNNKYVARLKSNNKEKDKIFEKGFKSFLASNYEWDIYFLDIILLLENYLLNFKEFSEDYTYYIYNNLRGLKTSKEYNNIINNPPNNQKLYEEALLLIEERNKVFLYYANKYNIKNLQIYLNQNQTQRVNTNNNTTSHSETNTSNNNQNTNNNNNNTTNNNNNNSSFNKLREEYKIELLTSSLVYNLLNRTEKEEKNDKKDKNSIYTTKFEISNFNVNEESLMGIITGIKFYNSIIEINFSGNLMGPKCLFWLGSIFKTNHNIRILDLSRTNIDLDCLYMFLEGTKYRNEALNNEQFNLDRLNLKDNNQITDIKNDQFEHPLGLILEKFKLKWLNLTNAKLGNSGISKFLNKYLYLMKQNKIYMENLILICNNFGNESCLDILGEIIQNKDICTLQNLILSKNLISTPPKVNDQVNYFDKFMKSVANSNIKELFLISCGIGKNKNDIQILYDMLCQNKSLVSLRLFGNEINNMEDFTKILGIFSEYNNGLKNSTMKSLDLSKNSCKIKIITNFWTNNVNKDNDD